MFMCLSNFHSISNGCFKWVSAKYVFPIFAYILDKCADSHIYKNHIKSRNNMTLSHALQLCV